MGELALSGEVRRVRGALHYNVGQDAGRKGIIVPIDNADEAAVVEGLDVYPVRTLRHAADMLAMGMNEPAYQVDPAPGVGES